MSSGNLASKDLGQEALGLGAGTSNAAVLSKLQVRNVSKSFGQGASSTEALQTISLDVQSGSFVCLVGPSGCGKTTLLRLIAGFERPSTGTILVDGTEVRGPGPDRMVMFQESTLFPWLNALQNIEFGLHLKTSLARAEKKDLACKYLELVGLKNFAKHRVHELSGGMRQRVALARALAPNPRMLLMDEPFASLDALTREQLYFDLQEIWASYGKTILLVTHNVREAACLGDRVLVFSPHPGRICADFAVELARPRDINNADLAQMAAELKLTLRENMQGERVLAL